MAVIIWHLVAVLMVAEMTSLMKVRQPRAEACVGTAIVVLQLDASEKFGFVVAIRDVRSIMLLRVPAGEMDRRLMISIYCVEMVWNVDGRC